MKLKTQMLRSLVLFVSLIPCAHAQTMFGGADCGTWVKQGSTADKAWVIGYLSALNAAWVIDGKRPYDPLGSLSSADQAFLWMDNYCRSKPLSQVSAGARQLFQELVKRKQP